jgi:iron complex outermembrane receptor protein
VFINAKNQLYASFAMANKEPSRDEQINNQNSPLQPETLYDAELGYQYKQKRFTLQVNGYFMYYKNQLLLSGKLNDVGNPIKINTPKSYRAGVELAADGVLWMSKKDQRALLSAGLNLSYSVNRIIRFSRESAHLRCRL